MKKRNTKFICIRCKKPVYRITNKTRVKEKICPKCNGKTKVFSERNQNIDDKTSVLDKIKEYRKKLDRVESLHLERPNLTFLELWGIVK